MKYPWIEEYLMRKIGVTKDLLDKSYQIVLGSFSKKKQKEILKTVIRHPIRTKGD